MVSKELQKRIEEYAANSRKALVEDLSTLVRIPSVSHFGADGLPFGKGVANALDKALEMAEGYGLTTENCGYWYGLAHYGEGDTTIGLFSHLDVVPEGNNWIYAPYEPLEKDGLLIGRGSTDNKNAAVVSLHVMKGLRELGIPLRSKITLFFGCSEETGMQDIDKFVEEQPMPDFSIVPDTTFPVCHGEKGILSFQAHCSTPWTKVTGLSGGVADNVVPDLASATLANEPALLAELTAAAEKAKGIAVAADGNAIVITATGRTAHAAQPENGVNAIHLLMKFLAGIQGIGADREICAFAAETTSDCYGEHLGIAMEDEPSGKLTCISGLAATEDGHLVMHYNVRYPVTHKGELVKADLEKTLSPKGWTVEGFTDSQPIYLPADNPNVQELCRIYGEVTGREAVPYVMGGGTYARHLKNAVGFGMETDTSTGLPEGHGRAHEPDEAMIIDELVDAVKIYLLSIVEVDALLHK